MEPVEFIISSAWDGRPRKLFRADCETCQKTTYRPKHQLRAKVFCSVECSAKARESKTAVTCATCAAPLLRAPSTLKKSRTGLLFCNRECKEKAQSLGGIERLKPGHYRTGIRSYRTRALHHFGSKCSKCGYDKFVEMLDVHHKDGNRHNNVLSNLEVACVWCHALATRGVPVHERG